MSAQLFLQNFGQSVAVLLGVNQIQFLQILGRSGTQDFKDAFFIRAPLSSAETVELFDVRLVLGSIVVVGSRGRTFLLLLETR